MQNDRRPRAQQARKNKQPKRRRQRQSRQGMGGAPQCVIDLSRSMKDPFNYSACIPDGTKYLSSFTTKQTGNLVTGTAGTAVGIYAGLQPDAFLIADSTGTASTITIPANWSAAGSVATIANLYSMYRVVSAGIKVWYTGASLSDSGVLIAGQMSSQFPISTFDGGSSTTLSGAASTYRIGSVRDGVSITWRPEDLHDQADLFDVDSTVNTKSTLCDHSWLFIAGFGLATNGAGSLQYEIIVNFEGQLANGTFMPGGQTVPEPAAPGWYEKAGNILKSVPAYGRPLADMASTVYGAYNSVYGGANGMRRLMSATRRIEL
jgi:hypothetical protein